MNPKFILFFVLFFFFPTLGFSENLKIISIVFKDPSHIFDQNDRSLLYTQKDFFYDPSLIKGDQKKMELILKNRGYFFGKIQVKKEKTKAGILIQFFVLEGSKVYIKKIVFPKNIHLSTVQYEKYLNKTIPLPAYPSYHPWSWFSWKKKRLYTPTNKINILKSIQTFGKRNGFWDIQVQIKKKIFSSSKKEVILFLSIEDGLLYKWGTISFKGEPSLKEEFFWSGQVFSKEKLEKKLLEIRKNWQKEGYLRGKISYSFHPQKKTKKIDCSIFAKKNKRLYIGKVFFSGNHTSHHILRSYITLFPGTILYAPDGQKSIQKLYSTGFFEKVNVQFHKNYSLENTFDVEIKVEKASDGHLQILSGFSSEMGIFGGGGFQIKNFDIFRIPWRYSQWGNAFQGGAQKLIVQSFWGEKARSARLFFQNPFLRGSDVTFTSTLFYNQWEWSYLREKRWGRTFSFSKKISFFQIQSGYSWENIHMDFRNSLISKNLQDLKKGLTIASFHLTPRIRKNAISLALQSEMGHTSMGSEVNFFKFLLPLKWKIPLFGNITFQGKMQGGWGRKFDGNILPYPLRFFLGGHSTLRGFVFRKIGKEEQGIYLGGSSFWNGRLEIHVPLFSRLALVGFMDSGNIGDTFQIFKSGSPRVSVGGGFRIYLFSKKTPLSLDFGIPLLYDLRDKKELLSFALEFDF